jgi:nitroreductase
MEFFDTLQARHSVRLFTSQPIPDEFVQRILHAVNRAPSAGNLQAYEVYLVKGASQKQALTEAAHGQGFLSQAPVVLAFCTHAERARERYGKRGTDLYCVQDATIACTVAMLAATALGLGSVWVGAFDETAVHQVIGAPVGILPIALLPVGYAAEEPPERSRRPLSELVHPV